LNWSIYVITEQNKSRDLRNMKGYKKIKQMFECPSLKMNSPSNVVLMKCSISSEGCCFVMRKNR
jgi:hypothetical protein